MENVLYDTVQDLIEKTTDPDLYSGEDFDSGYKMAIYNILSDIKVKVETYGLDITTYFGNFDPDGWLKNGREYRSK